MSISEIERLSAEEACAIINKFIATKSYAVEYDLNGSLLGDFERHYSHSGIYAFRLTKAGKTAIAYIGKTEKNGRIRQHLLSQNMDGSSLKSSTRTKHDKIKNAIENGFTVELCLYADTAFGKASLACIEIAAAQKAKECFVATFPDEVHWNTRLG